MFEKLGKSRTFLIYNEDKAEIEFQILAYYTLALQVLKVDEKFSNRKIKEFDGLSAKIHGERILEFPAILIGQLGKNDLYKDIIKGDEIMNYCLNTILDGQMCLGGRLIMLECKDVPYLIKFYESYGFRKIERDYKDNELLQFVKILNEKDLVNIESAD
ncbi:hypothetical protein [Caloramator australicus]|uniref:Acetyltransferase, GNAT family n=1 Tax=Caloramator australicus RC3 TaxID=857293 RepID=I7J652_9CLOT|nr:hypothetical protein [Caloramator australicus]CCJ34297.1 conserved hypothetical protein [Caloramator australicus RC3]